MRFLITSLAVIVALLTVTACTGKSSDNTSTEASAAASAEAASPEASSAASANPEASSAAGTIPTYPGATTQASGSSTNTMGSAAGSVMTSDDSFDKVYAWYQQNMPAGSEKSHVTAPVESAVFTIGDPSSGQTSVTITTSGGKTMITVAKVKT